MFEHPLQNLYEKACKTVLLYMLIFLHFELAKG